MDEIRKKLEAAQVALRQAMPQYGRHGVRDGEVSAQRRQCYAAIRAIDAVLAPARAAQPVALRLPDASQKLWSGREVQAWLDKLGPLYAAAPVAESAAAALAEREQSAEPLTPGDASLPAPGSAR